MISYFLCKILGMNKALIADCYRFIDCDDLDGLKEFYYELLDSEFDYNPNWQHIYQKIYLHACTKKKHKIVGWLLEIYNTLDPITMIALRQLFPYGRYLLAK